jgi:hypothetical protein
MPSSQKPPRLPTCWKIRLSGNYATRTLENARLKKMYAEERLKAEILKEAMAKKW